MNSHSARTTRRALLIVRRHSSRSRPPPRPRSPPPSQWYKLPGLNALSGAQWVRSIAYGTPPNIVYAGLEGGGVFKSTTGGATWSAFNSGSQPADHERPRAADLEHRHGPSTAGTDAGIYKSTGGAWSPLRRAPRTTRRTRRSSTSRCSR
jgi:hypothetical protein